jgi:hypothetical protein
VDWDQVRSDRRVARALLVIAVVLVALAIFVWVAAPAFMGGEPEVAGIPTSTLSMVIGAIVALVGLVWMWRIYKAPTRFESARWRYRDR